MIDKPLYIIIFMYSVSTMLLAGQYFLADAIGFQMTDMNGNALKTALLDATNWDALNLAVYNILHVNFTLTDIVSAFVAAGNVLFELLSILTGTYVFYLLTAFGIPQIVIMPILVLYIILLANMIIVRIRGS